MVIALNVKLGLVYRAVESYQINRTEKIARKKRPVFWPGPLITLARPNWPPSGPA